MHDGEVLDGYVVGPIFAASGGMSHLFNVTDPALPLLPLVMKVLPLDRTPDMIARMEREAYALSKMSGCDLIVRIQATGRCADGSPYIVMERLTGEDLKDFLRRSGPLEMSRAVDIGVKAALALYACHCQEVLHRDVKPGNLFLHKEAGMREVVKLLDFGISHTGVGPAITALNAYSGTRRYMAPEQWRGRDTELADQFSLAVVLFEALTARLPWPPPRHDDGGQHERLVMSGGFKRVAEVRADLPPGLGDVIGRALSPDPDSRFSSIHEFGEALLPFATDGARSFFKEYVPKGRVRSGITVRPLPVPNPNALGMGIPAPPPAAEGGSEYATVPTPSQKPLARSWRRKVLLGSGIAAAIVLVAGGLLLRAGEERSRLGSGPQSSAGPSLAPIPRKDKVSPLAEAPAMSPPASVADAAQPPTSGAPAHTSDEDFIGRDQGSQKPTSSMNRLDRKFQKAGVRRVPYSRPSGNRPGSAIPD